MQLKQAESKAMAQEAAVQEQEREADDMQIDLPPSYHDAVAAVIGTKSTEERALPPLPSSAPAMGWPASSSSSSLSSVGQVLHWQLENLQQSKIRLGLFDPSRGVQYPVIRAPLERVSGLSFAGVWDQTQMSLRHLKRCAVHIHTPSVSMHPHPVQCQLNNISRCSIDLTGEQSYLFVGLQLSSIKGSRVALGPAQGSVRLSKISKTTLIRSPTAAPPASLVYNASAVNLQGPSIFHAEKLSRCTLDLRSPATSTQQTAPFTKVILSRLSRCVVYLDYVPGSISLDKCKRCIVVIPCQQMTFRKCSRVRAYILPSTVISTERTRRIQLTPLSGNTYREYQMPATHLPQPRSPCSSPAINATTPSTLPASPPDYHVLFPSAGAAQSDMDDDKAMKKVPAASTSSAEVGMWSTQNVEQDTRANDQLGRWLDQAIDAEAWADDHHQQSSSASSASSISSISSCDERKKERRALKEQRRQEKKAQRAIRKAEKLERKGKKAMDY